MFNSVISTTNVTANSLRELMPIRRINDGRSVDTKTHRMINHLPDHLLHDIGLNRGR